MIFEQLRQRMAARPTFRTSDVRPDGRLLAHEHTQFHHWVKEGKLIRLRRDLYTLSDKDRKSPLAPEWLSNRMYSPSYLSLEWALSRHGIIPDAAVELTSVTTLKTMRFSNPFGTFSYRTMRSKYFYGFSQQKTSEGLTFWLAHPEKAALDFFYLSKTPATGDPAETILESYRFQNLDQMSPERLAKYNSAFPNGRVQSVGRILLELVKEDRA